MATDFSTATVVSQPAPYQHHAYKNSSNYNPMTSGANTPMNVSPTSPRSTSHLPPHLNYAPQIRPPKNPIYVPAALRRTEKPARQSPPKVDSAVDTPNSSWGSGTGFGQASGDATPTVSRIATEDLNSIYGDAPLSPITGPITRNHWQVRIAFINLPPYTVVSQTMIPPIVACYAIRGPVRFSAVTYFARGGSV